MLVDHHDLVAEFPEHKDRIHTLKTSDAHFRRLFDEYHAADRDVRRFEEGAAHCAGAELEEMKKKRLQLKDTLFGMLKAA